jgi:hypothetical protein
VDSNIEEIVEVASITGNGTLISAAPPHCIWNLIDIVVE